MSPEQIITLHEAVDAAVTIIPTSLSSARLQVNHSLIKNAVDAIVDNETTPLRAENERLKAEVGSLKIENATLEADLKEETTISLAFVESAERTKAERDALVAALVEARDRFPGWPKHVAACNRDLAKVVRP